MKKATNLILAVLLLLSIGYNVVQKFQVRKCERQARVIKTETVRDTIIQIKEVPLEPVIPDPIKTTDPRLPKMSTPVLPKIELGFFKARKDSILVHPVTPVVDTFNIYTDTLYQQGIALRYAHLVRGELMESQYKLWYPSQTSVTTTKTNVSKVARYSVYMNGGISTSPLLTDVFIGAAFANEKVLVTYQAGLGQKSHTFGIGYRLLGK